MIISLQAAVHIYAHPQKSMRTITFSSHEMRLQKMFWIQRKTHFQAGMSKVTNISGQQHTGNFYIERVLCLRWNCCMGHGIHCKVNPSSWILYRPLLHPYFQGSWPTLFGVAWGAKKKREWGKNATVVYVMIYMWKNPIWIFLVSSFSENSMYSYHPMKPFFVFSTAQWAVL